MESDSKKHSISLIEHTLFLKMVFIVGSILALNALIFVPPEIFDRARDFQSEGDTMRYYLNFGLAIITALFLLSLFLFAIHSVTKKIYIDQDGIKFRGFINRSCFWENVEKAKIDRTDFNTCLIIKSKQNEEFEIGIGNMDTAIVCQSILDQYVNKQKQMSEETVPSPPLNVQSRKTGVYKGKFRKVYAWSAAITIPIMIMIAMVSVFTAYSSIKKVPDPIAIFMVGASTFLAAFFIWIFFKLRGAIELFRGRYEVEFGTGTMTVRVFGQPERIFRIPDDLKETEYVDGEPHAYFENERKEFFAFNPYDLENPKEALNEYNLLVSNNAGEAIGDTRSTRDTNTFL